MLMSSEQDKLYKSIKDNNIEGIEEVSATLHENYRRYNARSISYAIEHNCKPQLIKLLIDKGAKVAIGYGYESNDLTFALRQQNLNNDLIEFLLANGAKVIDDLSELKQGMIDIARDHVDRVYHHLGENFSRDYDKTCFENNIPLYLTEFLRNMVYNPSWDRINIASVIENNRIVYLEYYIPGKSIVKHNITLNDAFGSENIDVILLILQHMQNNKMSTVGSNVHIEYITLIQRDNQLIVQDCKRCDYGTTVDIDNIITTSRISKIVTNQMKHPENKLKTMNLLIQAAEYGIKLEEILETTIKTRERESKTIRLDLSGKIGKPSSILNITEVPVIPFNMQPYSQALNCIKECISYQKYKEGAVIGLCESVDTNKDKADWKNLPQEIGIKI